MELQLKARHFKDATYSINENYGGLNPKCGCVIDRTLAEILPGHNIQEKIDEVIVNGRVFEHEHYGIYDFCKDKDDAIKCGFDDTVIRTINIPDLNI